MPLPKSSKISFISENSDFKLKNKTLFKEWINSVILKEKKILGGEINFVFCNDEYLLSLNEQFLKHDTFTDIITFDYTENGVIAGDVVISIDRVKENAEKFEVAFEVELKRIIIHGILHLIGYKDKNEKDKVEMTSKEDFYIKEFVV